MEIPVIVEKVNGNGFRARAATPEALSIEGPSREAVLAQMQELLQKKLSEVEVVRLQVPLPGEDHPWLAVAGMWKDSPDALEAEALACRSGTNRHARASVLSFAKSLRVRFMG